MAWISQVRDIGLSIGQCVTDLVVTSGVYHQYLEDLKLPIEEQYIQKVVHGPDRGVLMITFDYHLIQLIHKALSFEVDTTFVCVLSDLNEWEIVIWYTGTNRRTCSRLLIVVLCSCSASYQLSRLVARM
jgi:hypothetical protein